MLVILLLTSFLLLYCSVAGKSEQGIKENLLHSVLIFLLVLLGITEGLSLFSILNNSAIILSWSLVNGLLLGFLLRNKKEAFWPLKKLFAVVIKLPEKKERFLFIAIILGLIFFQGLIYPPNNWDSMTYHLPRITSWLGHESIDHYATHIVRQLYQPPFSEFVLMHVKVLGGGDLWLNTVQFFFWLGSALVVLLIVQSILPQASRRIRFLSVILALTIPEAILQASSTQNDIVLSFFILAALYYCIKLLKEFTVRGFLLLGAAVGLALLTKGLAYVYLAPMLVVFALVYIKQLIQSFSVKKIGFPIVAALICLTINAGHYARNYSLSGNVLGTEETENNMYFNEEMNPGLFLSNVVKNVGLQIGPYPINRAYDGLVTAFHNAFDIELNNPKTNFNSTTYSGSSDFPNDEDYASNPLHFWLILITCIILIVQLIRGKMKIGEYGFFLFVVFLLQMILFSFLLKWQPWHTRLHLPLFFSAIPLITLAITTKRKYLKRTYFMLPTFVFYGFLVVLFNFSRPFWPNGKTADISIFDSRGEKYFAKRPHLYQEYEQMARLIETSGSYKVGIIIGADDWEYPIFNAFNNEPCIPVHIYMSNYSKELLTGEEIDCVVSTSVNAPYIGYNEKEFLNQTEANQHVWFYLQ